MTDLSRRVPRRAAIDGRWLGRTGWRVLLVGLIVASGPLMLGAVIGDHGNRALYDFNGGLFNAGVAILHGHNPYQPGFLAHQAGIMRGGGIALGETELHPFSIPVYPAFANLLVVPLSLLPLGPAGLLYTLGSIAAMVGGLRLLGVRDWRCQALALVAWPFLFGAYLGAVGPWLVLGAGIAWRWRERIWPCGLAVASIIAAKIFPWPLGVWLLITKRYKALLVSIGACLAITFGAWAIIGFHGLAQYPQMLADMSFLQEGRAVSVVTVMLVAGVSPGLASVCAILLTAAILGLAWRVARRPDGDRRAFGLAVIAALTATPIVWEHYMVLLFIPIALASPQLSRLWLVPLLTPLTVLLSSVLMPDGKQVQAYSPNALRRALLWLVLETIVAVWLCTTPERRAAVWGRLRRPRARGGDHARLPRPHSPSSAIVTELNAQEVQNA